MTTYSNPPETRGRKTGSSPIAQWLYDLRAEATGEWSVYPLPVKSANPTATYIKTGKYYGLAPGEFDACTRKIDGESKLYARYRG